MTKNTEQTVNWTTSMASYGIAAGALGAISLSTQAAEQPFAPVGGLPIAVDDTMTSVDIDIDGDSTADFRVYRETAYGGGFAIGALSTGDSRNRVRAHFISRSPIVYYGFVLRQDSGEIASESGYGFTPDLYLSGALAPGGSGNGVAIDLAGGPGPFCCNIDVEFTPFRDNPGFISLVLRPDSGTAGVTPLIPRIAYIEVVVSPDGSELQILSGAYQDANFPDRMVLPAVTPPPTAKGLAELALGAQ